jgi:hypothetical protein
MPANLLMILLVLFVGVFVVRRMRAMREDGTNWNSPEAVAEVRGDVGSLCRRALQEVAGTTTDERFDRRVTFVATNGANAGFTLTPLDDDRTEVTVTVAGGLMSSELSVSGTRRRAELGEQLADWLAEHGDGRRVRHT